MSTLKDPLLTVNQVAMLLQMRPKTVYGLCAKGKLASVKLGGYCIRIPQSALDVYMTANTPKEK